MDGLFSFQCRSLKSIRDALGCDTPQTSTILLTTSRKNSFDQTSRASGFFTKGSTSFFIWFTSSLSIACDARKENSSLVRCSPSFTCPLWIILRSMWSRCSCGWYEAYHPGLYQYFLNFYSIIKHSMSTIIRHTVFILTVVLWLCHGF
jgi:hypothetical protein